jgi:hypothetical protein
VGGFYPFGDELAYFKTVHSMRERTVNLVGTHNETPVSKVRVDCRVGCVARLKRWDGLKPSSLVRFPVFFHCTPETAAVRL